MRMDRLNSAATDLTLVFGAESFILECASNTIADPDGQNCLAVLVDLIVNCEHLGLTLPKKRQRTSSKLIPRIRQYVSELPDGMLALSQETESAVVREFVNFARAKGWSWFNQWAAFQLTNSIVTNEHCLRLGGTIVSPEGAALWKEVGGDIKQKLAWPPLIQPLPAYILEHLNGIEVEDFPLAYSLDVYRRGWQYARRVSLSGTEVAYVPHSLRANCLAKTANWSEVQFRQDRLWSWGKYICAVLGDESLAAYRSPIAVAEVISTIRKAVSRQGGNLTWADSGALDDQGRIADPKYLRSVQSWVADTAKMAKLPLLREPTKLGSAATDLASVATDEALGAIENWAGLMILSPLRLARIAAAVISPACVGAIDTRIERIKRGVEARLFRASLGYGPLIPTAH